MRSLFFLIFLVFFLILVIRHIESRSIFFPMKGMPPLTGDALAHEEVSFETSDGKKLHGWFVPASSNKVTSMILFLHGNAGNMGHRWEKIRILHNLGASIFIFDYRGYGQSEGNPSEAGIYKDVEAAYAYLIKRDIKSESIVVYGESIGGAFAVDLAVKKAVKALIIEDTFTSIPAMVHRAIPFIPTFILATRLDSLSKISKVHVPKLIFHSIDDEIIPFEMGKALFAAADQPKDFVHLRGGHNTAFLDDFETYRGGLKKFLGE